MLSFIAKFNIVGPKLDKRGGLCLVVDNQHKTLLMNLYNIDQRWFKSSVHFKICNDQYLTKHIPNEF